MYFVTISRITPYIIIYNNAYILQGGKREQNHVRDAMANHGMYRSDALVNVSCGLCW